MNQGCSLVRCPRCGFEGIDPSRSKLVRLFSRWGSYSKGKGSFRWQNRGSGKKIDTEKSQKQLSELPPGSRSFVCGFQPHLSFENKARLQAYGLTPGQEILVLQQTPVTIVLIEHLELALENAMAKSVIVSG
jgi:Fe2+ transport system protein FeoA